MRTLLLSKRSAKYLQKLPLKQKGQIISKIRELQTNPEPPDHKKLKHSGYFSVRAGEHRIIYTWSKSDLNVALIGKRNDDDVYKRLDRFEG